MTTIAPTPLSINPDLPFKYVGGDPALDLVNTVDWTSRGLEHDRLTDYERLTHWAEGAGVISAAQAKSLRARARRRPRDAEAAYRMAERVLAGERFVTLLGATGTGKTAGRGHKGSKARAGHHGPGGGKPHRRIGYRVVGSGYENQPAENVPGSFRKRHDPCFEACDGPGKLRSVSA
jgi:hypothetical protein